MPLRNFGGGKKYNTNLFTHAKKMRRELTPWEKIVWHKINKEQLGYKFRRQQPIGNYIADFINFEKGIVIELDGSQQAEQYKYDSERDEYFTQCGFKVLRFWNNEVIENLEGVLARISETLEITPRISVADSTPPQGGSL